MTIVYILLGLVLIILIRIFGIVRENGIRLRDISEKVYFVYEQNLKAKEEQERQV